MLMDAISSLLRYLASDEAQAAIDANVYWPKWNSPWWHFTLLNEMGLAKQIPERAIRKMVEGLSTFPVKIFPIHPGDCPPGMDPVLDTQCHCGNGNIYQALFAWGVDVDRELPWLRSWFLRYQLPDGGLNCDND